ncbi:MAG: GH3 auxin-responsive promoter family protein [Lachnospiraceae bacterium]|nr:GH3 auxin-responsive promoter family protein [Lachnospiraceae bacterium]
MDNLTLAGQINYKKITDGEPIYQEFQKMSKEPMKYNTDLLMKILSDNKDTEYGKKYHFADIHSIEEFQGKVPVSRYDDYVDYILRETEGNEKHLLCAYDVMHYNKSSGTMGNPKRLPMSDKAIEIFGKYNNGYMNALLADKLGTDWINGKCMSITESASYINTLKNGATYGALSVKMVLNFREYLSLLFTSPDEATFPKSGVNTRYLHARFGLMDKDITNAGASFYSFYLELLRYIENKWELLVKDIELGTIDESIQMPDEVRESLIKKLQPMPERAAELRAIFEQGFEEPFVPKVWPKLKFLAGVGTGNFKVYGDKIKSLYTGDGVRHYKTGLSASEGIFSVPFDLDCEDSTFIPDSMFYEFLPLDAGDDFSKIVTLDKVEVGKDYEIITTNLSGFYRYRMRDAVRITGKYNELPTLQFLYRIDQTVSIMGEKSTEVAIRTAAENTAKELEFELIDFSMYPDLDARPVRYLYFMELGKMPDGLKAKEIRYVLEKKLAEANPSMGAKVAAGICGATKLNIVEPETYMLYRDLMVAKGTASGQVKPVSIITNELQRKFFFGLTEYGVELVK